jgi:AcrR family transcriptional regulator
METIDRPVIPAREPGLRERKRRETKRNIQLAVLRLAGEHGLDQVTVDDISREAGISPRTFFNYFATKEDSLAGDLPMVFDAETARAFEVPRPEGDPLGELIEIMAEQADGDEVVDPELHQLRRRLVADYPQIVAVKRDRVRAFEEAVGASVARRLAADAAMPAEAAPGTAGGSTGHPGAARSAPDADEIAERARLISLLVLTVSRAAWFSWLEHPGTASLRDLLLRSYARLHVVTTPGSSAARPH